MATVYKFPNSDLIMAIGGATKDGEYKEVGEKLTPMATFSLACGKKPNSEDTRFVDCQAWQRNAAYAGSVRKGETVMAIGRLKSREYNGKTYYNLECDFVSIMRSAAAAAPAAPFAGSSSDSGFMDALADADESEFPF